MSVRSHSVRRGNLRQSELAVLVVLCVVPFASEAVEEGAGLEACEHLEVDVSLLQTGTALSKQHPPQPPLAASELQQRPQSAADASSWPSGRQKSGIRMYLERNSPEAQAITRRPYALPLFVAWLVVVAVWALCSLIPWQQPNAPKLGAKPRDTTLDEAKFHLMTLVIFGHFLSQWRIGRDASALIWAVISTFHMPAFTLLCGFFCKPMPPAEQGGLDAQPGGRKAEDRLWQTCVNLLGGFLVAGWLVRAFWWFVAALDGVRTPLTPVQIKDVFAKVYLTMESPDSPWSHWFLIALFWWRMVWSPVSSVLHRRMRLPAAILAAWAFQGPQWSDEMQGAVNGTLALGRSFLLLPFYELGMQLSADDLHRLSTLPAVCLAVIMVCGVLPTCLWFPWPWIHDTIHIIGSGTVLGYVGISVVALSVLGTLLLGAQIGIETDLGKAIHTNIAALGTRTLYSYVLQFIVLLPIGQLIDFRPAFSGFAEPVSLFLLLVLAVAFNALLCSHFTERMFWWVCQPSYLFAPRPSAAQGSAKSPPGSGKG